MYIDLKVLKAVCEAGASKEETRYYLNGVYLQAHGNGVVMVATDGHKLVANFQECENAGDVDVIIPADMCKRWKFTRQHAHTMGNLTLNEDGKVSIEYMGETITFEPIDGTFPDWRRVIPQSVDGNTAQFNHSYLVAFDKYAKTLGMVSPALHHNGDGPAMVDFGESDHFGVVMPVRKSDSYSGLPEWAGTQSNAVEYLAA